MAAIVSMAAASEAARTAMMKPVEVQGPSCGAGLGLGGTMLVRQTRRTELSSAVLCRG